MLKKNVIRLGNLLLSLSDAVDLVSNELVQHQIRTAFIAWQLAEQMELSSDRIKITFIAALFHDVGALTAEEKTRIHRFEETQMGTHRQRGAALFHDNRLLAGLSPIIRDHHRPINDMHDSIETAGHLEAQIVNFADHLERSVRRDQYILHQVDTLLPELTGLSGATIHHDVVDVFMQISRREDFWLDLTSLRLYALLLHHGPFMRDELSPEELESVARMFLKVIDFRSRFTAMHSAGVTECARMLAENFGFSTLEVQEMKIAGMLHDLGKLSVPNAILEKPAGLTRQEFAVIRKHTYFTYMVLSSVSGMERIAEWGAFHRERLDGSGYPFHARDGRISTGARIVTVADMFTAMAEDRPYRQGREWKDIRKILLSQVDRGLLSRQVVEALLDNYAVIGKSVKAEQAAARASNVRFIDDKPETEATATN